MVSNNQQLLKDWKITINANDPIKARYHVIEPGCLVMQNLKEIKIAGERQLDRKV